MVETVSIFYAILCYLLLICKKLQPSSAPSFYTDPQNNFASLLSSMFRQCYSMVYQHEKLHCNVISYWTFL